MRLLNVGVVLVIPLLVAIYTWNYGRWAWRQRLRLGAVGLYLLAVITAVVPAWILWFNE